MSTKKVRPARKNRNRLIPAIGYLRASNDKQDTSCEDQKNEIIKQVEGTYEIVAWYIDDGVSGWKTELDRIGFQRAMEHASKGVGGAKTIVVWKQNRFSRMRPIKFSGYLDDLTDAGAYLYLVDYGIVDPNDMGDLLQAIIRAEQDYNYCKNLSGDVHRGMKALAEQGFWLRAAPLGYSLSDPQVGESRGRRLEANESEAETVRYIFSLFLQGLTTNKIAVRLNREQVKTYSVIRGWRKRHGYTGIPKDQRPYVCEKWNPTTVNQVLRSDVYIGNYRWGNRCESSFHDFHDVIFIENNHDALVSKLDYDRVQKLLSTRARGRRKQTREADKKAILGGLLRCGYCAEQNREGAMHKIGNTMESSYACKGAKTGCCCGNRVSVDKVLEKIVPEIVGYFQSDSVRERLRDHLMQFQKPSDGLGVDAIQEALDEKQSQLQKAKRNLAFVDQENIPIVEARITELKAEIRDLERRLDNAAKPESEIVGDVDESIEEMLTAYDELRLAFSEGDYAKIRVILEECVSEIVVFSERERGVLSTLWEAMPKEGTFTIDDLPRCELNRKQVGNRVNKLVRQGAVKVIKGRGGKGPGIYQRTDVAPKEVANTNYRLVRGSIKLQSQIMPNLASGEGHECKVSAAVSLDFTLENAA